MKSTIHAGKYTSPADLLSIAAIDKFPVCRTAIVIRINAILTTSAHKLKYNPSYIVNNAAILNILLIEEILHYLGCF